MGVFSNVNNLDGNLLLHGDALACSSKCNWCGAACQRCTADFTVSRETQACRKTNSLEGFSRALNWDLEANSLALEITTGIFIEKASDLCLTEEIRGPSKY